MSLLTGVPDVRQAEYYSCGASALQAAICHYGLNSSETDLRTMLSTNWTHGTYSWDLVRVAKELGFDAEWKENLTFVDLESALRQGFPPIVRAQHYTALNGTWENTWTVGHYMVVIGLDNRNVYLENPYLLGSRLNMTREDFNASWHSYVSEVPIPPDAQKHYHEGVFIRGTPVVCAEFIGIREKPSIVPPVVTQERTKGSARYRDEHARGTAPALFAPSFAPRYGANPPRRCRRRHPGPARASPSSTSGSPSPMTEERHWQMSAASIRSGAAHGSILL